MSLKELVFFLFFCCFKVSDEDGVVCDSSSPGLQILNDDEHIESVREESVEEEDNLYVEVEADTGFIS